MKVKFDLKIRAFFVKQEFVDGENITNEYKPQRRGDAEITLRLCVSA